MATKDTYIEAVGRRKTATARVRLFPAAKTSFVINERKAEDYFPTEHLQKTLQDAFAKVEGIAFKVSAKVMGGGIPAQAEAIRLGIARALVKDDITRRGDLKAAGYLKRDPRMKERKKFGLRSARRAPQWSKR
ncbi:30S ribosomal protein S9 [Candidatus Kaiserbacteria bacterium]|nr:MAG: 30S ribosomal protein S9 [Candidatus Kaiserbacteria bacterium]